MSIKLKTILCLFLVTKLTGNVRDLTEQAASSPGSWTYLRLYINCI